MIALKAWIIEHKLFVLAALMIMAGTTYYYLDRPEQVANQKLITTENTSPAKAEEIDQDENLKKTEAQQEDIIVDVKGQINQPGVYPANQAERVMDVIQRAGGLTDKADKSQVNFAAHVQDEMVIYIPAIGEVGTAPTNPGSSSTPLSKTVGSDTGKININKAVESDLQNLPGIGPAKAKAIMQYREENGPFKAAEDLKKISGIGDKTYEKLKDAVSLQ